jgi:hypothetical protein
MHVITRAACQPDVLCLWFKVQVGTSLGSDSGVSFVRPGRFLPSPAHSLRYFRAVFVRVSVVCVCWDRGRALGGLDFACGSGGADGGASWLG